MAAEPDIEDEDGREPAEDGSAPNRHAGGEGPLLKRWVVACLGVAVLAAVGAFVWRYSIQGDWARPAPKLDMRFETAAVRLALPQSVSPSEEYLGPDGEVVFVTQDEMRAIGQAAVLSANTARKLAAALAEREPTRRVEKLFALVNDVPATPEGDRQALMLYRFVTSALAPSEAATRDDTKAKLDRMIGCRFVGAKLPPCPDRPSDVPMWALAALAIVALTAGAYGLASAVAARRRARREERASEVDDVTGDEAEEGA